MAKPRTRQPVRTCCGCGERDQQAVLVRLTVAPNGVLAADQERRSVGRGTYLHRRGGCWEGFVRGRPYIRSLRRIVPRSERLAVVNALREAPQHGHRNDRHVNGTVARAGSTGDAWNASS